MAKQDVMEKVQKLVALARTKEDGEPTEEARTAATTIIDLMEEAELVLVPKSDLAAAAKAVQEATELRAKVKTAKKEGMVLGGLLAAYATKQGMF